MADQSSSPTPSAGSTAPSAPVMKYATKHGETKAYQMYWKTGTAGGTVKEYLALRFGGDPEDYQLPKTVSSKIEIIQVNPPPAPMLTVLDRDVLRKQKRDHDRAFEKSRREIQQQYWNLIEHRKSHEEIVKMIEQIRQDGPPEKKLKSEKSGEPATAATASTSKNGSQ